MIIELSITGMTIASALQHATKTLTTNQIVLYAVAGGLVRIILGFSNLYSALKINRKQALEAIITSLVLGIIAALLIRPDEWFVAALAGFGGRDVINAAYKGVIKKETGVTPAGLEKKTIEYNVTAPAYPAGLSVRQTKAYDFLMKYGKISMEQYQKLNRVSYTTAKNDLQDMVKKRIIRQYGSKRNIYYKLV